MLQKKHAADNIISKDMKLHKPTPMSWLFKVYQKSVVSDTFPSAWKMLYAFTKKAQQIPNNSFLVDSSKIIEHEKNIT